MKDLNYDEQCAAPSLEDVWIRRAQAGDSSAFAPLHARHYAAIRAHAERWLPCPHLADDVASETFVFAHRHLGEFTAGTAVAAWLRAIAWQLARAVRDRRAREARLLTRYSEALRLTAPSPAATARGQRRCAHLADALARLPEPQRQLVELCHGEGRTCDEAATLTGRTPVAVRIQLHRTRQQLRRWLASAEN